MTTSSGPGPGHVRGRGALAFVVVLLLAATVGPPAPARVAASSAASDAGAYTVVLAQAPAASYTGGVRGFRRTAGAAFDARSGAVLRYRQLLARRQAAVLARIGSPRTLYRYTTALNGFTARLTSAQVQQLRSDPSVLTVRADRRVRAATVHTPRLLGLTGRVGVWARTGGVAGAGRGVVVGVLDTGIWPENPSFAGAAGVPRVPGFRGACQPGEQWPRATCGSKVVSARYFHRGLSSVTDIADEDYLSPRDGEGHGSHTAGIAAGRSGVPVTVEGERRGRASGMAPAAKIAVYKVLWSVRDPYTGALQTIGVDSDVIAAIDRAVRDGVDVLNLPVAGSGPESFADPSNLALLNAASAGVFVAAAAGNSGPESATVRNLAPWVTTTAASTTHLYRGTVVLGDGHRYVGAMVSNRAVVRRPLVYAGDVPGPGVPAEAAALCAPGSLDAVRVRARIVVCDRGTYPRNLKSVEVRRAGGAGMVLVNVAATDSLDEEVHPVPTVHLRVRAGTAVRRYARTQGARASLDPAGQDRTPLPRVADFSARGPAVAGDGDLVKPDLAAPGSSILAPVAPPFKLGRQWELLSGTSMASAHVAGLAALIRARRPAWSPMAVKSAMMTTATDLKGRHRPFVQGAGQVNPRRFLHPGLVLDSRAHDWWRFLAGQGRTTASGALVGIRPLDASALNLASIGVGDLVDRRTVFRQVTNVTNRPERYTISSEGLPGIRVRPWVERLRVGPGRTRAIAVTFTVTAAARFGRFERGRLVLRGHRGHVARLPVVIRVER